MVVSPCEWATDQFCSSDPRQGCVFRGVETVIGYDADASQLYVDRTKSGNVGFDPTFSGVQRALSEQRGASHESYERDRVRGHSDHLHFAQGVAYGCEVGEDHL